MDKISIFFVLVVIAAVFFILEPVNSDFVVYEPNFSYNESLINLSNYKYQLNLITKQENYTISLVNSSYIIQAKQKFIDVTDNLQVKDNNIVWVGKDFNNFNTVDIIFDHNLTNNDKILMYIKGIFDSEIYLCPYNTDCDKPGYGLINYDGQEGFYEIMINNLTNPTNQLRVDPPQIILFDYIYANYTIREEYINVTTIYPESATLISEFIEPENLFSFGLLKKYEELNNQSILYEYSTNENWSLIENFNLSYVDSLKIKFRITLQSDTLNTPILYNLNLTYYLKENPPENPGSFGVSSKKQINTINMESYRKVTVPVKLSGVTVKSLKKPMSNNLITGEIVKVRTHTKFSTYVNTVLLIMLSISGILCYRSFRKNQDIFKSNSWFKFKKK